MPESNRSSRIQAAVAVSTLLLVLLAGYLVWDAQDATSTPATLPGDFPAFEADLTFDIGPKHTTGHLVWHDLRNWTLMVYEQDRLIGSQTVVDGALTIGLPRFGATTVFPEKVNRGPGPWLITSATALGRGGTRDAGTGFALERERPCANDPAISSICGNKQSITEVVEHEFAADTGIPVRYSVYLEGQLVEEVRLVNIKLIGR